MTSTGATGSILHRSKHEICSVKYKFHWISSVSLVIMLKQTIRTYHQAPTSRRVLIIFVSANTETRICRVDQFLPEPSQVHPRWKGGVDYHGATIVLGVKQIIRCIAIREYTSEEKMSLVRGAPLNYQPQSMTGITDLSFIPDLASQRNGCEIFCAHFVQNLAAKSVEDLAWVMVRELPESQYPLSCFWWTFTLDNTVQPKLVQLACCGTPVRSGAEKNPW